MSPSGKRIMDIVLYAYESRADAAPAGTPANSEAEAPLEAA